MGSRSKLSWDQRCSGQNFCDQSWFQVKVVMRSKLLRTKNIWPKLLWDQKKSDQSWSDQTFRLKVDYNHFWLFWPRKGHNSPFHPRVWGGHKSDKKLIGHRFHAFLGGLNPNFWRFLAFLGKFWWILTPKSHNRPFWPRVWGGHKSNKNRFNTRVKSWVFGHPGHRVVTGKGFSGNGLKMILGVRRFSWYKKIRVSTLLWGSFWPPKEKYIYWAAQKFCPNFFNFFYIFEKLMNWALIFGFGFEPYLDYYWPQGHSKNG